MTPSGGGDIPKVVCVFVCVCVCVCVGGGGGGGEKRETLVYGKVDKNTQKNRERAPHYTTSCNLKKKAYCRTV